MKQIATGRFAQAAGKYAEHAPTAAVCCNACRTCVSTNIIGLAMVPLIAAAAGISQFAKRFARAS
jgi:hypothetical protein